MAAKANSTIRRSKAEPAPKKSSKNVARKPITIGAARLNKKPATRPLTFSFNTKGRQGEHLWWGGIKPSGNYVADCARGHELAQEWLATSNTNVGRTMLGWIVRDMPRGEFSGLEVGFFAEVATYAAAAFATIELRKAA